MSYSCKILPSVRRKFQGYQRDYGEPFVTDTTEWMKKIVAAVSTGKSLPTARVDELLMELVESDNPPWRSRSNWAYAWQQFRKTDMLGRIRAALAVIRERKPPWEIHFIAAEFNGHGGATPIELQAYFRIVRGEKIVIFDDLEVYTP